MSSGKYWYSDKIPNGPLIELEDNEEHDSYIEKNFEVLFPDKDISEVTNLDFRGYAINHGFARIVKDKDDIKVQYDDCFTKRKDLWDAVLTQVDANQEYDTFRVYDTPDFDKSTVTRKEVKMKKPHMINNSKQIKSSPNFKEFTADEIFDTFNTEELTDTVFMDREQCKANKCGMDDFTELMWDVAPTWLGIHNPDDVREVCRRAKNPKAKAFLEAFETALENAKFTDKFYDSIKIHKKGEIASSISQEEFENLVIDIEDRLGVNVEHSNIFNLPVELTYEDECYIDDICREQNCRFVPVNGSRRRYRLIQSRRNNMIKSALDTWVDPRSKIKGWKVKVLDVYPDDYSGSTTAKVELFDPEGNPQGEDNIFIHRQDVKIGETYDAYIDGIMAMPRIIGVLDISYDEVPSMKNVTKERYLKSDYTRSDSERFDEYGYFNPYTPTEEELAKKDEIKKVLEQELSDAYEPDPMDDYAGYDSTNERIDMACERVAKQFNVDTDFVDQIAGEIQNEANEMNFKEWEWVNTPGNLTGEQYDQYMNGELDVRPLMLKNSRQIKSSYEDAFTVHPWDTNQVTGTSDEDLGLSYVVEAYGNEFVNVDDETLNDIRDKVLLRYFDDDAYVRDWNINYPNDQIESIYDIEDPEDLNNEELARYFDYEAYGRDLRLNHNMVWDSEEECWVSAHDVDDSELDNDKYIFMRG